MLRNNKVLLGGLLISLGVLFGGCNLATKPADVSTESPVTTLTGVISVNDRGYMIDANGKFVELDARKVDLKSYVGKTATVVGQFSGTTLFLDSVK